MTMCNQTVKMTMCNQTVMGTAGDAQGYVDTVEELSNYSCNFGEKKCFGCNKSFFFIYIYIYRYIK